MGITEAKILYFCYSNRMMGWQSVNRVLTGVQLGQALSFGLIIWEVVPKGKPAFHIPPYSRYGTNALWEGWLTSEEDSPERCQALQMVVLKSSDLCGQMTAVVPLQGGPRRNHNAQSHMTPVRYSMVRGYTCRDPQKIVAWAGCLRVTVLHVCDEWRWLGTIPFFAATFFPYKQLNKLYVNWHVSCHPLCSP